VPPSIVTRVWREPTTAVLAGRSAWRWWWRWRSIRFRAVPLLVLLARTLFAALMLVLVLRCGPADRRCCRAGWRRPWRGAPVATAIVYLVATSGDVRSFVGNLYRVAGFLWIAGCALGIACW
jgi:hypothetical protein